MRSPAPTTTRPQRVRIGISACLLGERVRYDGGHKRDGFLVERFGRYVEWVPVCPEVESGMPVPRDFLRLVAVGDRVRMVTPATGRDYTAGMQRYARERVRALATENLSGYVFKRGSPSCGVERVRVYRDGIPGSSGRGLFASTFMDANPTLPVEEEGRLNDPRLCENFVSRVFAYSRWQSLGRLRRGKLAEFHAAHKFVLMAHSQEGLRRLGTIVGGAQEYPGIRALAETYWTEFSEVMKRTPSRRNHTNVLQHMAGFVSDKTDPEDRAELAEAIDRYRLERIPLIVPLTLLRHWVRRLRIGYLENQVYLDPHPDELMLLNQL